MHHLEKKISWPTLSLIFITLVIFIVGLLMVFNASSADALEHLAFHKRHYAMLRQLFNFIVGLLVCLIFWKIGYYELIRISPLMMILMTVSLLLVFVPGVGRCVNGSRRWIVVGGFVGQPSEFLKIVMPLYFIHKIVAKSCTLKQLLTTFVKIGIPIFLVMIEPSNGITAMLAATFICLMFLSRLSYKWWLWPIVTFAVMGSVAATQVPYVRARIQSYLHPEQDLLGKGHQPFQSKIAMGSGGVLGRGLGQSMQKMSYLPEAQNDYIAAIYAEEMGFIGVLALVSLYMILAFLGFSIALNATNREASILAATLTFSLCLQTFLNLAVVSGLLPSTGLNLPFFSQGGSSLLANMIVMTILININYHTLKNKKKQWSIAS